MTARDRKLFDSLKLKLKIILIAYGVCFMLAWPLYVIEVADAGSTVKSIGDASWLIFTSISTIGFGDIAPVTPNGKLLIIASWVITRVAFLAVMFMAAWRFMLGKKGGELTRDERILIIEQELKNVLALASENNKEIKRQSKESRAFKSQRGDYHASSFTSLKDIVSCPTNKVGTVHCTFRYNSLGSVQAADMHLVLTSAKTNGVKLLKFPDHEIDVQDLNL
ncbi:putative Ion_trans_2 domain-containing protein [Vibrio chagasii]|nr:putative Ion_trans_2 domain-containing protein [Vibrio chagasii]